MDAKTRAYIEAELLTISELAHLLGLTSFAAMKQAERKQWDYVLKGRQKLYWRGDFPALSWEEDTSQRPI